MNSPEQQPLQAAESIRDERVRHLNTAFYNLALARDRLRPEVVATQHFFQPSVEPSTQPPQTTEADDRLEYLRKQIDKLEDAA